MRLLLVALAISAFLALAQLEGSLPQRPVAIPTFELRADTTCPAVQPEAEGVLDRFLLSTGYEEAFDTYGLSGVDTSEVGLVADPSICIALDSTIAQVLADSILTFEPTMYDRTYFATDSFYYAVDLPHPPDSTQTPPPGIDGYVFVGMTGIILFGKDYSFKRGFPF